MTVSLQEWTVENAAARVGILNNPEVNRFLSPGLPIPYTLQDSMDFLEFCRTRHWHEWAVAVDGVPVGSVGIRPTAEASAVELGYYLSPSHHRRGIMTRAMGLLLPRVPQLAPGATLLIARVYDYNQASQALLSRCGFRLSPRPCFEMGRDGLEHRLLRFDLPIPPSTDTTRI